MMEFIPSLSVCLLVGLLSIARFENQRWIRARARGMRGASDGIGAFADITGLLGFLFGLAFLGAFSFDNGWKETLGLIVIALLASVVWSVVSTAIFRGDNFFLWLIGTLATWPLAILLACQVSWFGIVQ